MKKIVREIDFDGSSEYSDYCRESNDESYSSENTEKNNIAKFKKLKDNIENNIEQVNKYAICYIVINNLFPRMNFWIKIKTFSFQEKMVLFVIMFFKHVI